MGYANPFSMKGFAVSAPRPTSTKRNRERAKSEKRKEKARRYQERAQEKATRPRPDDGTDPDLEGIRPGPQEPLY